MGEITDRVREFIPSTYDALTKATVYGATAIQRTADTLKYRLFGTSVSATLEATTYNSFVLDYVAKLTTIKIIPAGVDYWSDQLISETTPQESINYPDRMNSLWKIHEQLLIEVKGDQTVFNKLFPDRLRYSHLNVAVVDTTEEFLTLDPMDFGHASAQKPFGRRTSNVVPWTRWS